MVGHLLQASIPRSFHHLHRGLIAHFGSRILMATGTWVTRSAKEHSDPL
jgi:hypothetical protein